MTSKSESQQMLEMQAALSTTKSLSEVSEEEGWRKKQLRKQSQLKAFFKQSTHVLMPA
jgi:hypothetical protein